MTFEAFLLILKEDQWCCSSLFLLTTFQPSLWKKHWIFLIVLKDLQLMCLLFTSLKCIQLFSLVLECHLCYSRFPLCCLKWKCFDHFFPLLTFWSTCCNDFSVFCILSWVQDPILHFLLSFDTIDVTCSAFTFQLIFPWINCIFLISVFWSSKGQQNLSIYWFLMSTYFPCHQHLSISLIIPIQLELNYSENIVGCFSIFYTLWR